MGVNVKRLLGAAILAIGSTAAAAAEDTIRQAHPRLDLRLLEPEADAYARIPLGRCLAYPAS